MTATQPLDRRRLRSARGRDAVVDALLALYAQGAVQPSASEIASRAGVSERSVFRYFEDLEALALAAIHRHWEHVGAAFAPPAASGDRHARAVALVDQRLRIHRAAGPMARVAELLALRSSSVAGGLALRRQALRDQVAGLFPEVAALADLLAALDAATSLEQIEYLRGAAGLSPARTRAVVLRTVEALLDSSRSPSGRRR